MTRKSMVAFPTNEAKTEFGRPRVIATERLQDHLDKGYVEVGADESGQLVPSVSAMDDEATAPLSADAKDNLAAAAIVTASQPDEDDGEPVTDGGEA